MNGWEITQVSKEEDAKLTLCSASSCSRTRLGLGTNVAPAGFCVFILKEMCWNNNTPRTRVISFAATPHRDGLDCFVCLPFGSHSQEFIIFRFEMA